MVTNILHHLLHNLSTRLFNPVVSVAGAKASAMIYNIDETAVYSGDLERNIHYTLCISGILY